MENKTQKSKKIQQKQINIKGMSCQSCADSIREKLNVLEGVEEAEVSFAQERAFVQFDPKQISLNTIDGEIKKMGYKPSIENGTDNNPQKEKIIKIRLEKPGILTVLVGIALILASISLFQTSNLRSQLASVAGGVVIESEGQPTGALKEVQPKQPSNGEVLQQPSKVEVDVDDDPVKGSESAPVTIIEFSEYECPFCKRFFDQTFSQIEENYIKTGKVRYVFRDFPLGFHQYAQKAAEAAECADEQGKFWQYHDKLFENQDALGIDSLKQYAKELSLNAVKFNNCLDSGKMASEVEKDLSDGLEYGVEGTPMFFINGVGLSGAQPYSAFEQIIEQELDKIK